MDYFNQTPAEFGFLYSVNHMSEDQYSNMSDDEKREYIERNRGRLSNKEIDKLSASLGNDEEDHADTIT